MKEKACSAKEKSKYNIIYSHFLYSINMHNDVALVITVDTTEKFIFVSQEACEFFIETKCTSTKFSIIVLRNSKALPRRKKTRKIIACGIDLFDMSKIIGEEIFRGKYNLDAQTVYNDFYNSFKYENKISRETCREMAQAYIKKNNIKRSPDSISKPYSNPVSFVNDASFKPKVVIKKAVKEKKVIKRISFEEYAGFVFAQEATSYTLVKIDNKLKDCFIPKTIRSVPVKINPDAFDESLSLQNIEFDEGYEDEFVPYLRNLRNIKGIKVGSKQLDFFGGVLLEDKKKIIWYPSTLKAKRYPIPNFIEEISSGAFYKANNLTSIRLGKGLKRINSEAFDGLSLPTITIPLNVEIVEEKAFKNMKGLSLAMIDSNSDMISPKLFDNCKNLSMVFSKNEGLKSNESMIRDSTASSEFHLYSDCEEDSQNLFSLARTVKLNVVRDVLCFRNKHKWELMRTKICVLKGNKLFDCITPVFHCQSCGSYYVTVDIYERFILPKCDISSKMLIDINFPRDYQERRVSCYRQAEVGLSDTSILKEIGYSVAKGVNLSQANRLDAIRKGIEHGVITKVEVINLLQYFISFHGSKVSNYDAKKKWKADLEALLSQKYKQPYILY